MKSQKISYKRGDVVLALFPNSSLRTAKRRPALIVQANHLGTGLSQVIVAMISSNMSRAGHASRFTVRRSSLLFHASGLLSDSVVMTDNLATITTKVLKRVSENSPQRQPSPPSRWRVSHRERGNND